MLRIFRKTTLHVAALAAVASLGLLTTRQASAQELAPTQEPRSLQELEPSQVPEPSPVSAETCPESAGTCPGSGVGCRHAVGCRHGFGAGQGCLMCLRNHNQFVNCRPRNYGQPELFYNYYVPGNCGGVPAAMYLAPRPVPPLVGHTYYTYQPFMPHELLYQHHRDYYRYYHGGRGLTRTHVSWTRPPLTGWTSTLRIAR